MSNPDKGWSQSASEMAKIQARQASRMSWNAVGNRDIGARGLGNWYPTDTEIKMGKSYADENRKKLPKFITDSVDRGEYVNRIGQNIVKNSDCKVPFYHQGGRFGRDQRLALPGGFFYVNSGLILNVQMRKLNWPA